MPETKNHSEQLLVSELKSGNEKAFRQLFDHYYQDIYGYSISLLKSKEAAEENVQDVFMKVWQHRENLNAEQSFKAYIFTIARNQAFNTLNKAANDLALKEAVFYESQKSHEYGDYSIREADCKKLRKQAMKQLPPKRKQIFKMSRKKGMSYEEISQELGISINTVRNQMSKALESMRVFFHLHDEII
ncbi:RNA polymerase sigma-70 factor, ECF subfamily [Flavobacterium aquidurense]|uniref:RNA polymerase sigma-70 factor n=1 Tax=Flavobacterium frigidimaris TaxID=262320 RepID=A0ABX4BMM6_FLAFR|nr:RNA polymerase sigma-70 factor [Flavobacterium frigidimaris]OXA76827.1 RNA polymerase sigma-70 factor [Flavobacterium frigidimaris]SDZ60825.1 RNA polymerase sigma-70 factor, ECF subfamily [Flavobacterium aquidurense]